MSKLDQPIRDLLGKQFDLEFSEDTDEELFDKLSDRIAELLIDQMESFMSMMYRLDVSEQKVRYALSPDNPNPPNVTLATLIIERQVQRVQTKRKYTQTPLNDWMDF